MMMQVEYSKRLGSISPEQFQRALDHFNLGQFIRAEAIPFGLFGQNVFVTSTKGEYVLRGAAHYDWQFPKEQFIANLLHDRTTVPAPWPYLIDTDESIFGWAYGYVFMPLMPGLQLASGEVAKTLSPQDRQAIAFTIGENLREIQRAQWPFAGQYDLRTQTIAPFENGFDGWLVSEVRRFLQLSLSYDTGASQADAEWIESIIQTAAGSLKLPYTPVLVLHDYREPNLTVSKQADRWVVSGVFDLMEALSGDGELDLIRQLATYIEGNQLAWAQAFLDGYRKSTPLRPQAQQRLALYMVYDRIVVWEYYHRPANISLFPNQTSIEAWITTYLNQLASLLK
ncbi:MAG: aminoglycoside phosphotransferase family protein [Chloroflexi bacterium]|nr:aminoglycoside phosphotransferase family protein [Chloroflexota bacterium]MCC6895899.1 aminoglycoside phosphotransferase family protein [Anaerolineae bacterium]